MTFGGIAEMIPRAPVHFAGRFSYVCGPFLLPPVKGEARTPTIIDDGIVFSKYL